VDKNMFSKYCAYIKDNPEKKWFKAKLYGWGWTPATWQGWLVILVFIGLLAADFYRLDLDSNSASDTLRPFFLDMILLVGLLLWICYKKGEKPRWQWGVPKKYKDRDESQD